LRDAVVFEKRIGLFLLADIKIKLEGNSVQALDHIDPPEACVFQGTDKIVSEDRSVDHAAAVNIPSFILLPQVKNIENQDLILQIVPDVKDD
jgi:hypothetical protein